jgi:PPOX class probable F420-dependent enzyme
MVLSPEQRAFLTTARTAILATVAPDGTPRLVPICFVLDGDRVVSALDEKPKRTADPRDLARVRDILARPRVSLLVHRWDEDWSRLAWVRLHGVATLTEPGMVSLGVVEDLRAKYPQYETQAIDRRPMLSVAIDRISSWGNLED